MREKIETVAICAHETVFILEEVLPKAKACFEALLFVPIREKISQEGYMPLTPDGIKVFGGD